MSSLDAAQWAGKVIERWGFPVMVATAFMWVLRTDVLVPLVEEHRSFIRELVDTQQEISRTMQEQTRLIYSIQHGQPRFSFDIPEDGLPQN